MKAFLIYQVVAYALAFFMKVHKSCTTRCGETRFWAIFMACWAFALGAWAAVLLARLP